MAETSIPGEYNGEKLHEIVQSVPEKLRRATTRLQFPPSYVVVGVYRLFTDKSLAVPAWKKCEHGFVRGAGVSLVWVSMSESRSNAMLMLPLRRC